MKKVAIITTHPIQYNAPLFELLSHDPEIAIKVFYTWSQSKAGAKYDPDFGKVIEWDIPLLSGYDFEFIDNISKDPGSHHFAGIDNPSLNAKIKNWGPDFLLVFGWSYKSHLSCLRYFKGKIPVVFRGDSTLIDEKKGIKLLLRRLFLRWVYSHIDYALYVGKHNKDYFLAHGVKEKKLVFGPHAIDTKRFSDEHDLKETKAKDWRKQLNISDDDIVFLFAGKLEDKKDPYFILRLANKVNNPGIKFVIVGNGKLESDLTRLSSKDKRIIFIDFQNQLMMPVVYRLADILILPSIKNETWGLAVNEAMSCSRPVIVSTKVACSPDLVLQNVTGWVFEPGERGEAEVVDIIFNIVKGQADLDKMRIQAFNKIQDYTYDVIVRNFKKLINEHK